MDAVNYFSQQDKDKIRKAIEGAELNTSGEVRVHIENCCKGSALDRAAYLFDKMNMQKTKLRNGVLFYLAFKDHKFAILGDAGINQKVPEGFWDNIKEEMIALFKKEAFADGLAKGITMAGEQLKKHFPYQQDDVNELSDDISFGRQ